jgi:hypothetical protein
VAKLSIGEEEADECLYWLKLLESTKSIPVERIQSLAAEAEVIAGPVIQRAAGLIPKLRM